MNTSQFMDKQIMDLTSSATSPSVQPSPPLQNTDGDEDGSIDLPMNLEQEKDPCQQQRQNSLYDMSTIIGDENGIKKEEIVPSYDFHPIRPIVSNNLDSSVSRAWTSASNSTDFSLRNHGSLDSMQRAKVIVENEQNAFDAAIASEIDKTMKKYTDNLLHSLEGVSARLTQLESRSRHLENSVDELKVSVGNNHGCIDEKIGQVEKALTKLQTGVEVLKDKHEVFEAQLKLGRLQLSKAEEQQLETQISGHMDTVQQSASAPPQSRQHLPPGTFPQSVLPVPVVPPPSIPQHNIPLPVPLPNQFPHSQLPSVPQSDPYYSSLSQNQETTNPQYQITPPQQPQPSNAAPLHQSYETAQPQYSQPPLLSQPQASGGHHPHPVEAPYNSSQSFPSSLRLPSSQPPGGAPHPQQYYGAHSHMFEQPPSRPSSGFSAGYGPPSRPTEAYASSGSPSQYGSSPAIKKPHHFSPAMSQSSGTGYPQLPTARVLPHALPTASPVGSGSVSPSNGSRVPIEDVVDKVSTMGFPREHVRATVRKLTENGQSVDLNTVLDKLMNDGEVHPQRPWFGQ